jgi:hypothetical protein
VVSLMTAVPALVRAIRYGNVRGTPAAPLAAVVDALVIRICAGLPAAAGGLADDAAARLRTAMDGLHAALGVYGQPDSDSPARWAGALRQLDGRRDVHGLVAGRVVRMLADAGGLSWADSAVRFRAALSVGATAAAKAAWAEGFLGGQGEDSAGSAGSGLLLVHDRELLGVLDEWVADLPGPDFQEVLPLLRRTFSGFSHPERAAIGRAARALGGQRTARGGPWSPGMPWGAAMGAEGSAEPFDQARAAGAVRTVAGILSGAAR